MMKFDVAEVLLHRDNAECGDVVWSLGFFILDGLFSSVFSSVFCILVMIRIAGGGARLKLGSNGVGLIGCRWLQKSSGWD